MDTTLAIPEQDLPLWMRQARRGWDWALLLVACFSLLAGWGFAVQEGLPRTNASENYAFMAADYATALGEGRLYPRWSAHALNGYGAPIPHYVPPGAGYSAALLTILVTDDPLQAVRILFIAAFWLGGTALYHFVNRRAGPDAGLVALLIYVFSPFFGHTTPYLLGDLALMLALALAPTLLWTVDRLVIHDSPFDFLWATLITAALLLTHPALAAGTVILAAGLALTLRLTTGRSVRWLLALMALFSGAALSAFYWLPALAEIDQVRWLPPLAPAPGLTLGGLFTPFTPIDLAELSPAPQFTLGIVGLVATLIGLLALPWTLRRHPTLAIFLIVGVIGGGIGIALLPGHIWLLGLLMLCIAIGSSAVITARQHLPERARRVALAGLIAAILAASSAIWLPPRWPATFGEITPAAQINYEQQGFGVAVLPPGWPVPSTLETASTINRDLMRGYQTGVLNRLTALSNRGGAVVRQQTHSALFQIHLPIATRVQVALAHFPGWRAFMDGVEIPLMRQPATGLMMADVHEGRGELRITLEGTPIRERAWLLSWLTLATVLLLTHIRLRRGGHTPDFELPRLPIAEIRLISAICISFTAGVIAFAVQPGDVSFYPRPGHRLDGAFEMRSVTDAGLELLAYRVERGSHHPGEALSLTLYWRALRFLPENYQLQVLLERVEDGSRWGRSPLQAPSPHPTRRWVAGRYVRDQRTIQLSPTIIPGEYRLAVEVFACNPACSPLDAINFYGPNGSRLGGTLILPGPIMINP